LTADVIGLKKGKRSRTGDSVKKTATEKRIRNCSGGMHKVITTKKADRIALIVIAIVDYEADSRRSTRENYRKKYRGYYVQRAQIARTRVEKYETKG